MAQQVTLLIEQRDITEIVADVIVLKYAQGFHGADRTVSQALSESTHSLDTMRPGVGAYAYLDSRGTINSSHVLFVGVPSLLNFEYKQIRQFSSRALEVLAQVAPATGHVAMTIHGPGSGLDEEAAFLAQIEGYLDAFRPGRAPSALKRITIVDRNAIASCGYVRLQSSGC